MPEIAYVPGYTYDIFISYPFQADAGEWVSQLNEDVEKRLTEMVSEDIFQVGFESIRKHLREAA